jgi:signal transduction histidine kinase
MDLAELLRSQREDLLLRFVHRARAAQAGRGVALPGILILDGLPGFLERLAQAIDRDEDPGAAIGGSSTEPGAAEHGEQRQALGFDVAAVIREYGILEDVILELLGERDGAFDPEVYRLLSRHLSAATAAAVQRYADVRDLERDGLMARHAGFLAHELRGKLVIAQLALSWWQQKPDIAAFAIGALEESLSGLSGTLERELLQARLDGNRARLAPQRSEVAASELVAPVLRELTNSARARAVAIEVAIEPGLRLAVDPRLLRSALTTLLASALAHTATGKAIQLRAERRDGLILIEVEDACGGRDPAELERLFSAGDSGSAAGRPAAGLDLAIARDAIAAHGGLLSVRDLPGRGCVLRIQLPG